MVLIANCTWKSVCTVAVLGLALLGTLPAFSKNAQEILTILQRDDKALQQGTISYEKSHTPTNNSKDNTDETYKLHYDQHGRYHLTSTDHSGSTVEKVFDGTDDLLIHKLGNRKEVTFDCGDSHISKRDGLYDLVPGPCFALGRGLSSLKDITITSNASGIRLHGVVDKHSAFEASLDPNHGYVATEIVRKDTDPQGNEHVVAAWHLVSPRQYGQSPYIMTNSSYAFSNVVDHYLVKQADFTVPDNAQFSYNWRQSGGTLWDSRLGRGRPAYYGRDKIPPNVTSAQLLQTSRAQLEEEARIEADVAAKEKARRQRMVLIPASIIVVVGMVLTMIALDRIVKRKRPG